MNVAEHIVCDFQDRIIHINTQTVLYKVLDILRLNSGAISERMLAPIIINDINVMVAERIEEYLDKIDETYIKNKIKNILISEVIHD